MSRSLNYLLHAVVSTALLLPSACAAPKVDTVNMTIDEEPIVPALARSLGCLAREHIALNVINILDLVPEDYEMQTPLNDGRVDVAYHWFNHTVFGARHALPVIGVMNFNDAPGMKVLVANVKRDQIRSAADFSGRAIASGAIYGTKSIITAALARKNGISQSSYSQKAIESEGRQQAIEQGLAANTVDLVTSEEPLTSAIMATGRVTPLYNLTDRAKTTEALGASWPAQSLLMAPKFIAKKPEVAQRVVNAFVCAMRFVNSHDAEEIVARLPADYLAGKDKAALTHQISLEMPSFAKGDYRFRAADVELTTRAIEAYRFDDGPEGKWRSSSNGAAIDMSKLYDNRLVEKAMTLVK